MQMPIFKRPLRFFILLTLAWSLLNSALVAASWGRSYFATIAPLPQVLALDLRTDTTVPGQVVTIIATKPTPSQSDFIGHIWVAWPKTPPFAPAGSKEGGYYAKDQMRAAGALAGALLAPWGFIRGQTPVEGYMRIDDGLWRHAQLSVTVDDARYRAALLVDTKWRRETRYSLRPSLVGKRAHQTFGCQDYVFDVAQALGLKAHDRDWKRFPMEAFLDIANDNGVIVIGRN
jgi:hypothetical protein